MAATQVRMPVLADPSGVTDPDTRCPCVGEGSPLVMFWFREVGDEVSAGEPLVEVALGWVIHDIESPVAGTVAEIFVQAGETVQEGGVLGEIETGED